MRPTLFALIPPSGALIAAPSPIRAMPQFSCLDASKRIRSTRFCLSSKDDQSDTPKNLDCLPTSLREDIALPMGVLLAAQFVLFVGVGAVIPTLPLYGKAIGLSSAVNGIVISAPAVALLIGARAAGEVRTATDAFNAIRFISGITCLAHN
jgi:hypothetical protein